MAKPTTPAARAPAPKPPRLENCEVAGSILVLKTSAGMMQLAGAELDALVTAAEAARANRSAA